MRWLSRVGGDAGGGAEGNEELVRQQFAQGAGDSETANAGVEDAEGRMGIWGGRHGLEVRCSRFSVSGREVRAMTS